MSSPEDDDDRGSGPLSSPEPMSLENSYPPYHSPSPNRQPFMSAYAQPFAQPLSTSPTNYNPHDGGFVPINQQFPSNTTGLDTTQSRFPITTEPIAIPQASYSTSPPVAEPNPVFADFFAQNSVFVGADVTGQFPQENWLDLYNPTTTSLSWGSNGNQWNEGAYEMQAVYSSQGHGQEGPSVMDIRRGSLYFPTVLFLK